VHYRDFLLCLLSHADIDKKTEQSASSRNFFLNSRDSRDSGARVCVCVRVCAGLIRHAICSGDRTSPSLRPLRFYSEHARVRQNLSSHGNESAHRWNSLCLGIVLMKATVPMSKVVIDRNRPNVIGRTCIGSRFPTSRSIARKSSRRLVHFSSTSRGTSRLDRYKSFATERTS